MSMMERVARALVVAKFGPDALLMFDPVPAGFPLSKEAESKFGQRILEARREARAAIEALREPTMDILAAGYDKHWRLDTQLGRAGALEMYERLINAMLDDGDAAWWAALDEGSAGMMTHESYGD